MISNKDNKIIYSAFNRYFWAIFATLVCLYLQILMKPIFGTTQYFLLFPLVFIVVALGGLGPALVVIFLGASGEVAVPDDCTGATTTRCPNSVQSSESNKSTSAVNNAANTMPPHNAAPRTPFVPIAPQLTRSGE